MIWQRRLGLWVFSLLSFFYICLLRSWVEILVVEFASVCVCVFFFSFNLLIFVYGLFSGQNQPDRECTRYKVCYRESMTTCKSTFLLFIFLNQPCHISILVLIKVPFKNNFREFSITSMSGSYRRVFQKPVNYEWYAFASCFFSSNFFKSFLFYMCIIFCLCCRELLTYTDGTVPLAETDLDIIAKSKPAKDVDKDLLNGNQETHVDNHCTTELKPIDCDVELQTDIKRVDGEREVDQQADSRCRTNSQEPQMALKLSFTLPASCYATMAIRELLKTSTSVRTFLRSPSHSVNRLDIDNSLGRKCSKLQGIICPN